MYKDKNKMVEDSFQAYLVEGANFTKNEEYPILEKDIIPTVPPNKIMPFDKALNYKGDLSDIYVCTYARDCTFERVRKNPNKYISFFKRCAGIIGFDFSVHSDMPIIKQKSQMNDNLSLSYYFGKKGIKVIPNIRYGVEELSDEFLSAIPKHSLIAIGTHGFIKETYQKAEWFCFIERVISSLEPTGIVVYGRLNGKLFDGLFDRCRFFCYEPWIYSDRKRRGGIQDVN